MDQSVKDALYWVDEHADGLGLWGETFKLLAKTIRDYELDLAAAQVVIAESKLDALQSKNTVREIRANHQNSCGKKEK